MIILSRLLILTLALITMVLCYGSYRLQNINRPEIFERRLMRHEDFQAGDVLLLSFENYGKMVTDSLFNIQFIHPTLVVEEENQKYIIELMDYNNGKKGFQKMKLDEWIGRNKRNLILINKMETDDESREEFSRRILSFCSRFSDGQDKISTVGGFDSTWLRYINPTGRYKEQKIENDKTTCNEFCVFLLTKSGVVEKTKDVSFYHPDAFIGMKDFKTLKPYKYSSHFLCDLSRYRTG